MASPSSEGEFIDEPIKPSVRPEKRPPITTRNAEKRTLNTNSVDERELSFQGGDGESAEN